MKNRNNKAKGSNFFYQVQFRLFSYILKLFPDFINFVVSIGSKDAEKLVTKFFV